PGARAKVFSGAPPPLRGKRPQSSKRKLMGLFRKERSSPPPRAERPPIDRLDVQLLQSSAVTLYHKANLLAHDIAALQHFGYRIYTLDAALWQSAADFHAAARREFAFPDYYAANLASWIDCLGEIH